MKTLTQLDNLTELSSTLQEKLCAAFPEIVYFQVNCALENEMLMVEIEHPEDSSPNPEALLSVVEASLTDLDTNSPLPVNLFVKIPASNQPYGLYSFVLPPLGKRSSLGSKSKTSSTAKSPVSAFNPQDRVVSQSSSNTPNRLKTLAIALGFLVGLGALGLAGYTLTRPCVIGSCQEIATARQLQEKSNQEQAASQSASDIAQAKEPLATAIADLKTIPSWSGSYSQAQSLQADYQNQINWLESMRMGLDRIEQANAKSKNPPLTVAQWRETEKLWQASVNDLQQVPATSSAYPLAQAKLKQSQNNLAAAKTQIATAQKAENTLKKGQEKYRVAKALQGIAQSVPEWQKAKANWQGAISELEKVDKGTAARNSAEKTLADAQKQLKVSSDRLSLEERSANNYNYSRKLAQKAQDFQVADQWSKAVATWNAAISLGQQIPKNTFYYAKAQPDIASYRQALNEAKTQLALSNQRRDRAQQALKKLCATKPPICSFKLLDDGLKVTLSPAYTAAVKQASLNAKQKGDYNTQAAIVDRVLALGENLNNISNSFRMRLELYGDNGKIIQVYNPTR